METFSLAELEEADLLERKDFKYVFNNKHLPEVLHAIAPYYNILNINGNYFTNYITKYYDTIDFKYYLQHHNGLANRFKIRTRRYQESDLNFFEVKFKNNKNWTDKKRYRIQSLEQDISAYIATATKDILEQKLDVQYLRITLLSKDSSEKITLDLNLNYSNEQSSKSFDKICIAEVKSKTHHPYIFRQNMKILGYRNTSLSKYCFGIATLYDNIKMNNFKPTINKIFKLIA